MLSPPKNLVPSAHRRSISSSTCSIEKSVSRSNVIGWPNDAAQNEAQAQDFDLNGFLKVQRTKVEKVLDGQVNSKAKIVLSDTSNSKLFRVSINHAKEIIFLNRGRNGIIVTMLAT